MSDGDRDLSGAFFQERHFGGDFKCSDQFSPSPTTRQNAVAPQVSFCRAQETRWASNGRATALLEVYTIRMEPRGLPFSRIRLPRIPDCRALTAQEHQAVHCTRYAAPTYPADAKLKRIEGTVILDALIGKNGEIQTLSVHSGHPVLAESALQAVRHWAYRPIQVNGIAVEVQTQIEVTFTLSDPS
jgi:TonB family protein